jgi:hypothetical protein
MILAVLVGADARSAWNRLRHRGLGRRGAVVVAVAVAFGLPFLGLSFGFGYLVGSLASGAGAGVLASAFTGLVVLTLVLGLPSVITAFFADRVLLLLALAPIRALEVFVARLVVASAPDWAISSLLLALVAGYGAGSGAGPAYYLLAVVALALVVVSAVSLQLSVLSLLLRAVPAARARDVANLAAGLVGAAIYVAWLLFVRSPVERGSQAVGRLAALGGALTWVPTAWPARALALAVHRPVPALAWLGATAGLTALLLLGGWLAYRRAFLLGVGVYGAASIRRRAPGAPRTAAARGPVRTLLRKDLLTLRRDLRRLAGLLPSLAVSLVYPLIFLRTGGQGTFWTAMPAALFGPFLISTTFGLPAVAMEGRGMQLLVVAGISGWSVLRAKLALAAPLALAVGVGGAVLAGLAGHGSPAQVALAVPAAAWVGAGWGGIWGGGGGVPPDFSATDPRRSVRTSARLLALALELAFAVLSVGAVALVLLAETAPPWRLWLALGAMVATFTGAAVPVVALLLGARRLAALSLESFA